MELAGGPWHACDRKGLNSLLKNHGGYIFYYFFVCTKSEKMKISKKQKNVFFLMSQGSFNPKIKFLVEKVCPVACLHTDRRTDRQTE